MSTIREQHPPPPPDRRRLRILLMYVLPSLIALFVVLMPLLSTVSVLPRIRISPGFALLDQRGETLTNAELHGDIAVFGLVSLKCDRNCAATLDAMREAAAQANVVTGEPDQPGLKLIAIVVDPVEDAQRLADFAAERGLDSKGWSVVSGSAATVRALVSSGFEVHLATLAGGTVHDPAVFLTDHAGILRAEYRTGNPRSSTIAADIDRILNEANSGAVGGLLYNAAHSLSLSCGT